MSQILLAYFMITFDTFFNPKIYYACHLETIDTLSSPSGGHRYICLDIWTPQIHFPIQRYIIQCIQMPQILNADFLTKFDYFFQSKDILSVPFRDHRYTFQVIWGTQIHFPCHLDTTDTFSLSQIHYIRHLVVIDTKCRPFLPIDILSALFV